MRGFHASDHSGESLPCPECGEHSTYRGRFGLCRLCEHWELYEESWEREPEDPAHDEPESDLWFAPIYLIEVQGVLLFDGTPFDPEAA